MPQITHIAANSAQLRRVTGRTYRAALTTTGEFRPSRPQIVTMRRRSMQAGLVHSCRVQTVSLTWQHAGELAGVLALSSAALRTVPRRFVRGFLAPFVFEAAIIGVLYAMWQLAGELSVLGTSGAMQRARWIERFDNDLPLPSEHTLNHAILAHPLLVQAANLYYATMHFTMMFVFLIWLFVRHRDRYRPIRTTMAWTTFFCLVIQLLPVAPPRMLGPFVDTGDIYHQSVYSAGLAADQLSAMPSVHVAWAVLVGYYVATISPSRWRWIGPLHSVITILVVVCTANHWWLDGIVASAVLVACAWARHGVATAWHALLARFRPSPPPTHGVEIPESDAESGVPTPRVAAP